MKILTYNYEKMLRAGQILNALPFCGVQQARLIAELGDILDSGTPGEIVEKEVEKDAVHTKEVRTNKLEK